MLEARQPDETRAVEIAGGYRVVTYSVGAGDEAVLRLNGGPGLPCDYLREPHSGYSSTASDLRSPSPRRHRIQRNRRFVGR